MNELKQLQQQFQHFLLNNDQAFCQQIVTTQRVSSEQRLAIYGEAYRLRLIEALAANYPVLQQMMGEDAFAECAYGYIDKHTSRYRNIRWFGEHLPNYLENYPANYLVEFAQFEWALGLAFDAADQAAYTAEELTTIAPQQWPLLRFTLHPAVQRLDFSWNVVELWQAYKQQREPIEPKKTDIPTAWLVWRQELQARFNSLNVDEAWALDAAIAGETFATICEGLCEWIDETHVAMHAASLLKGWLEAELVVDVRLSRVVTQSF